MICFFVNKSILKLFHQNIAGFISKRDVLEITLAEICKKGKKPDVICLSETFIRLGSECCINLVGYNVATTYCRKNGKNRGGVCILIKKGIKFKELLDVKKYAIDTTFECCAVNLIDYKISIVCLYRTPDSNVNIFLSNLEELLHKYMKNSKSRLILAGDLNINTLEPSNSTKHLTDIAKKFNLNIHISEPTRKKTCIDHLISNIDKAFSELHHLYL